MPKTELDVFFRTQTKNSRKQTLKMELDSEDDRGNVLYPLAGNIVNFRFPGRVDEPTSAHMSKINKTSKKVVFELDIHSEDKAKAKALYDHAGTKEEITLELEPSQTSLEDFYDQDIEDGVMEEPEEDTEYAADLTEVKQEPPDNADPFASDSDDDLED